MVTIFLRLLSVIFSLATLTFVTYYVIIALQIDKTFNLSSIPFDNAANTADNTVSYLSLRSGVSYNTLDYIVFGNK